MSKIRISKKMKEIFPPCVLHKIKELGEEYNIKSLNLEKTDEGKAFFVAEGDRYFGIGPDGRTASFEVVTNNTVGAANVSHRIGEQFKMPAGSYLLNVWYYSGYYLTVYQICPKMLNQE